MSHNTYRLCNIFPGHEQGTDPEEEGGSVLDFEEEDGSTREARELHIYALPLYWVCELSCTLHLFCLPGTERWS